MEGRPIALRQSEESFWWKFRCRWFHSGAVVAEEEGRGLESWDIPRKGPFHESEVDMVEVVLLVCLVCVLYEELEPSYSNPEDLIMAQVVVELVTHPL